MKMTPNINDLVKSVTCNGVVVTHRVTDPRLGSEEFRSSTYIQKENILVKGECFNRNKNRNALLVFFDLAKPRVKGGTTFFVSLSVT